MKRYWRILMLAASCCLGFFLFVQVGEYIGGGFGFARSRNVPARYLYPGLLQTLYNRVNLKNQEQLKWDRYAYAQYATDSEYLTNSIIAFKRLRQHGTKAHLVLMYNQDLSSPGAVTPSMTSKMIDRYAKKLDIKLYPVRNFQLAGEDPTWETSFTKFSIFNLTQYDQIIYYDSDSVQVQPMDELFLLDVDFATPDSYFLHMHKEEAEQREREEKKEQESQEQDKLDGNEGDENVKNEVSDGEIRVLESLGDDIPTESEKAELAEKVLNVGAPDGDIVGFVGEKLKLMPAIDRKRVIWNAQIMVIRPNIEVFRDLEAMARSKASNEYDMDLLNTYMCNRTDLKQVVLPHSIYGAVTGELRRENHDSFFTDGIELVNKGTRKGAGDAFQNVFGQTKFVHFSDWPVPKPWRLNYILDEQQIRAIVVCENDEKRIKKYSKKGITPTVVADCAAANLWHEMREDFFLEYQSILRGEGDRSAG